MRLLSPVIDDVLIAINKKRDDHVERDHRFSAI